MPGQALRSIAYAPDHSPNLGLQHVQREFNLPQLIAPPGVNLLAQRVVTHAFGPTRQRIQRPQNPSNCRRTQHTARQPNQHCGLPVYLWQPHRAQDGYCAQHHAD